MSRNRQIFKNFPSTQHSSPTPKLVDIDIDDISEHVSDERLIHIHKNSPTNSRGTLASLWPTQTRKSLTPLSDADSEHSNGTKKVYNLPPYAFSSNSNSLANKGQTRSTRNLIRKTEEKKIELGQVLTQVKSSFQGNKKNRDLNSAEIAEKSEILYKEHLFQTFQAMKFVRGLPGVDMAQLRQKRVDLEKRSGFESKKTIVFDLDETLVHCVDQADLTPDVKLTIRFPSGDSIEAGINIRPYAKECLIEAVKYFEVIVFTASHKCYADVVLDYLDPTHELIHHRLYRENCLVVEGVFMKDLRILTNRRIQDLVIVDNAAYSFGYQLDNGIPIISWHDDPYDKELFNLMNYIKILSQEEDVREVNRNVFHMKTFYEDYMQEFLRADKAHALSPRHNKTHKK